MQNAPGYKVEFHPPEMFGVLLNHEVNRSRRYGDSLTLVNLLVEAEGLDAGALQHADAILAEVLARHLRETDVLCKQGHEFLILMTSTSTPGARTACERVRKLIPAEQRSGDGVPLKLSAYIGMASLPGDHSINGDEFMREASAAMRYARENHCASAIAFSEMPSP